MFVIECCNTQYRSIDDVKRINEFGRRLGIPFWPSGEYKGEKNALYLRIADPDKNKVLANDDFLRNFEGK